MTQDTKYLFTMTHCDGDRRPRRHAVRARQQRARVPAPTCCYGSRSRAPNSESEARRTDGRAKSFPPVAELLKTFTENGGRIGVCPPCGKTHGVTDENMLKNGEWMGASAVLCRRPGSPAFSF